MAAPKFTSEHSGLYDEVITDENDEPIEMRPATQTFKKPGLFEKTLALKLRANPAGSYWFVAHIEPPKGGTGHQIGRDPGGYITLAPDKAEWFILDIPMKTSIPGTYTLTLDIAGVRICRLELDVPESPPKH